MAAVTWGGVSTPDNQKYIVVRKAGGTIAKHDMVYIDLTANNVVKAASNGAAASAVVYGMALHAASSGEYVLIATNGATVTVGSGPTAKTRYCLGNTAGASELQSDLTGGEYITEVFFANSTTEIVIDIKVTGLTA